MLNICVIGAGGVIGLALCRRLLAAGHSITALSKSSSRPQNLGECRWETGEQSILRVLREERLWDVVYDLRAYRPSDLDWLAEQASDMTRHWIHVSTIYVYAQLSTAWACSDFSQFLPFPLCESTPCRPSGEYGVSKARCECVWLDAYKSYRAPVTIARMPFIYGSGDRSKRANFYVQAIRSGRPIILPNGGKTKIDLVFSDDIAEALTRLGGNPEAIGRILNVTVCNATTLRAHIEAIAQVVGHSVTIEERPFRPSIDEHPPFAFPMDVVMSNVQLQALIGRINSTPLPIAWKIALEGIAP